MSERDVPPARAVRGHPVGLHPVRHGADPRGLICCSVSGYGLDGPYRLKKAYDLLIQCETGLLMTTGTPEAPSKTGVSIADIASGMYATAAS